MAPILAYNSQMYIISESRRCISAGKKSLTPTACHFISPRINSLRLVSLSETHPVSSDDNVDNDSNLQQQRRSAAVEPFLHDMRRVLHARRDAILQNPVLAAGLYERRKKPPFLSEDVDGAQRCLIMLRHLPHHSNNNSDTAQQQRLGTSFLEEAYQIVMRAFLQRGRLRWQPGAGKMIICAADQLEELLEELETILSTTTTQQSSVQQKQQVPIHLGLETYNLVLEAYAVCSTPRGDRHYANRAHDLLGHLERTFPAIPVESYLHVLHAYAWQQANLPPVTGDGTNGAEEAVQLLHTICRATSDVAVRLQAHVYATEACSKTVGGAVQCHELLGTLKTLNASLVTAYNDGDDSKATAAGQMLDAEVYSNAVLAWSKQAAADDDELAAARAHALLLELIDQYTAGAFPAGSEPPLIAFNAVTWAWGKVDRPDRAEEVLWLMEQKVRPICQRLVPDSMAYNSVLHGILQTPDRDVALKSALRVVTYMEEHCATQPAIRPNCFSYHILMKCWLQQSNSQSAADEAEKLLRKIEQLWFSGDDSIELTNRIYNMVMNAYAKSSTTSAGARSSQRALDLLQRMKASQRCKPDIISYTSAIECLSKSSDPAAPALAEDLLQEADGRYRETGDAALMPNLRAYTMTIQTLALNGGSVVRARALLTQLLQRYEVDRDPRLLPNTYPFNYVLNCAANTLENKIEAFQIAAQTYQEMRKSDVVSPDSFSYAFWFKCCNNLLEAGDLRSRGVAYAFEECKKEGLVNNEVLKRLFQGSPGQLVDQLLEHNINKSNNEVSMIKSNPPPARHNDNYSYRSISVRNLPPSWSRNTRQR